MPDTLSWIGNAVPVAQVENRVPATVGIGNDFSVTIGGNTVTFRATAATVANVTAGLTAAVNASTAPPAFKRILAADLTTSINFSARNSGEPFLATYAAAVGSGGGAPTFAAGVATISSAGPNHWGNAANWRTAAGVFKVPVTGDSAIFETGNVPCLYDMDQSGVTLALLEVRPSYRGFLGLPRYNSNGYYNYLPDYLKIGATILNVDTPSQRIKVDTLAIQAAANCKATGSPIEEGIPAFLWKGTHAGNTFQMSKGYAGIAFFPGETANVADLNTTYHQNRETDVNLWAGEGANFSATIDKNGGTLYLKSDLATIINRAGLTYIDGDGIDIGTVLKIDGGTVFYSSNGIIALIENRDDGGVDFDGDSRACTVTDFRCYGDIRRIVDTYTRVVKTNGIELHGGSLGSQSLQLGEHIKITVVKLP